VTRIFLGRTCRAYGGLSLEAPNNTQTRACRGVPRSHQTLAPGVTPAHASIATSWSQRRPKLILGSEMTDSEEVRRTDAFLRSCMLHFSTTIARMGSERRDHIRAMLSRWDGAFRSPTSDRCRLIKHTSRAVDILMSHKANQNEEQLQPASTWEDQGLVWSNLRTGKPG
jgi:hypothetical protein